MIRRLLRGCDVCGRRHRRSWCIEGQLEFDRRMDELEAKCADTPLEEPS